jgi:hypothetical protein
VALVVPDEGEVELLRRMLKPAAGDSLPLKLRLFTALAAPPGNGSTLADVTEATFAGYVEKDLDPTVWAPPMSVANVAQTQYGATFLTWLASAGSQVVTGYYVTNNPGTKLLWLELFIAGVTVTTTTPASVYPYLRLRSLF